MYPMVIQFAVGAMFGHGFDSAIFVLVTSSTTPIAVCSYSKSGNKHFRNRIAVGVVSPLLLFSFLAVVIIFVALADRVRTHTKSPIKVCFLECLVECPGFVWVFAGVLIDNRVVSGRKFGDVPLNQFVFKNIPPAFVLQGL